MGAAAGLDLEHPAVTIPWSATMPDVHRLLADHLAVPGHPWVTDVRWLGVAFAQVTFGASGERLDRVELRRGERHGWKPPTLTGGPVDSALTTRFGGGVEATAPPGDWAHRRVTRRVVDGLTIDHGYYEEQTGRMGDEWVEEKVIVRTGT